jgi:hypothetical protein
LGGVVTDHSSGSEPGQTGLDLGGGQAQLAGQAGHCEQFPVVAVGEVVDDAVGVSDATTVGELVQEAAFTGEAPRWRRAERTAEGAVAEVELP